MCLILIGWNVHPSYSLIVASNRDEFFDRPTEEINWWDDYPNILGGRDKAEVLGNTGTWMGISNAGRFAAITNVRAPNEKNINLKTRGEITREFLISSKSLTDFICDDEINFNDYNGFNLIVGDLRSNKISWVSNRQLNNSKISQQKSLIPAILEPGIYGLSNAMLDTPWPKVEKSKSRFKEIIKFDNGNFGSSNNYFDLLLNNELAHDSELPHTGISYEWEKILSSPFIRTNNYGTRSSSLLRVKKTGEFELIENRFGAQGPIDSKSILGKII